MPPILSMVGGDDMQVQDILSPTSTLDYPHIVTPTIDQFPQQITKVSPVKEDSEDVNDDTPLIDAIATAMVGEWMWKYKQQQQKTFGGGSNQFADDGSAKQAGTRQKRWVWISPYERTIMWSSKQPIGGAALMGKSGRKRRPTPTFFATQTDMSTVVIKSMLDVKDNNPAPKGESADSVFDRSIVVLTETRALKFTASSRERHYHWLMALSFLTNPTLGAPLVPRLPTQTKVERANIEQTSPEKRKDALIKRSANQAQDRSSYAPSMLSQPNTPAEIDGMATMKPLEVAPPSKSRLHSMGGRQHARKRSNSGPTRPPSSFGAGRLLSFTSMRSRAPTITSVQPDPATAVSSRHHSIVPSSSHGGRVTSPTAFASPVAYRTRGHAHPNNSLFSIDMREEAEIQKAGEGAVDGTGIPGTMRMTAFVDTSVHDGVLYVPPLSPEQKKGKQFGRNVEGIGEVRYTPTPDSLEDGAAGAGRGGGSPELIIQGRRDEVVRDEGTIERKVARSGNKMNDRKKRNRKAYVVDEEGNDPFRGF